jgi:hypothetical protein
VRCARHGRGRIAVASKGTKSAQPRLGLHPYAIVFFKCLDPSVNDLRLYWLVGLLPGSIRSGQKVDH